jgi:hypothetical protein
MIIALPFFVCLLGLLMWFILDPKFCCGLLVTLFNRNEIIGLVVK